MFVKIDNCTALPRHGMQFYSEIHHRQLLGSAGPAASSQMGFLILWRMEDMQLIQYTALLVLRAEQHGA